jgi:hypothetical protein
MRVARDIHVVDIVSPGDCSVGIPDWTCRIGDGESLLFDCSFNGPDETANERERVREILRMAFVNILDDGPVEVTFDGDYPEDEVTE